MSKRHAYALLFALAVPLALIGCSALQTRAQVSPVDQHFMLNAASVGVAEVRMAELAVTRASDPAVLEFAQHMIADHSRVNAQLLQVARANGVVLPMMMDPANRTLYEELGMLSGAEFDRQYMIAQVNIHSMGNALYVTEAQNGLAADVKRFAADNAPVGEEHLMVARTIASSALAGR